ncbi:leukocyte elastase inhibitor [Rhipicephalus sanguineus]|uniref:leukocyte elastase inhibitor n=1 Tax=Rhipicephalus sanguineus TaxID=34632 RepID=UPI00189325B3|nr:leukocyte elastase inhibitor [Rhipicephalus sanguineus]
MASTEDVRARPGTAKLSPTRATKVPTTGEGVARTCNDLAVSMCKRLLRIKEQDIKPGDTPDNIAFSPLAVASGLSVVLAVTSGRTAKQLSAALVADVRTVHEQFRHVFNELGHMHGQVSLSLANRLYADDRLRPLGGYQATLDRCYKSPVESERFHADPEACRSSINACVERTTCSRVKELLPRGILDCGTLLALVSALDFKGRWNTPFDPGRTVPGDFHESRTRVVRTRMMWGDAPARLNHYCEGLAGRAIDVPYEDNGGRFSMTLLVPDQLDGLGALVESLTPERLNRILRGFDPQQDAQLELPRFKLEDTTDLRVVLQEMGVTDLFDPLVAEFPGFTMSRDPSEESSSGLQTNGLALSVAVHKAFIDVNEEGTGTTAPKDVPETPGSFLKDPSRFRVDRPFYFLIRCHNPEVILFAGTVHHVQPL